VAFHLAPAEVLMCGRYTLPLDMDMDVVSL